MTPPRKPTTADQALIETCRNKSIELLRRNLTPAGMLAATPGDRSGSAGCS